MLRSSIFIRRIKEMTKFFVSGILFIHIFVGGLMASNLERSKKFFEDLNINTMNLVDEFYDPQVVFQDPIHILQGSSQVKSYYENLYKNVDSIRFEFLEAIESGRTVSLTWRMHLKTPALNDGQEFSVDGVSIIHFGENSKVLRHRDFFDMGEFVYERVSVLKWIIQYIKGRMAGQK